MTRCVNCKEWLTITPQITPEVDASPPVLFSMDMYALDIEWDRPTPDHPSLPRLVGPFASEHEATGWARLNIPNGSWNVTPLAWPYLRSPGGTP